MADINQLKNDVQWWTDELRKKQHELDDAMRMLKTRQDELNRAIREEAGRNSNESR